MPYMMSPPFVPHFATKASAQLEISSFIWSFPAYKNIIYDVW
jgi:hypothetical protein